MAPIHISASNGQLHLVKKELERGTDINLTDQATGDTCLHKACAHNQEELMQFLLANRANVAIKNKLFRTPLHMACEVGNSNMVKLLLQCAADPEVADKGRQSPLHKACFHGHAQAARLLLQAVKAKQASARQVTLPGSNASLMSNQMQGYADFKDLAGWSPLHLAAQRGHADVITTLLEFGSDHTVVNQFLSTPLHEAVRAGSSTSVRVLVANGANVELKDKKGRTPIDYMGSQSAKMKAELEAAFKLEDPCTIATEDAKPPPTVVEIPDDSDEQPAEISREQFLSKLRLEDDEEEDDDDEDDAES